MAATHAAPARTACPCRIGRSFRPAAACRARSLWKRPTYTA